MKYGIILSFAVIFQTYFCSRRVGDDERKRYCIECRRLLIKGI